MVVKEFPGEGNSARQLCLTLREVISRLSPASSRKLGQSQNRYAFCEYPRPLASGRDWHAIARLFVYRPRWRKYKLRLPTRHAGTMEHIGVDYKDEPHGSFEVTTKEAAPRRIFVDDPWCDVGAAT